MLSCVDIQFPVYETGIKQIDWSKRKEIAQKDVIPTIIRAIHKLPCVEFD